MRLSSRSRAGSASALSTPASRSASARSIGSPASGEIWGIVISANAVPTISILPPTASILLHVRRNEPANLRAERPRSITGAEDRRGNPRVDGSRSPPDHPHLRPRLRSLPPATPQPPSGRCPTSSSSRLPPESETLHIVDSSIHGAGSPSPRSPASTEVTPLLHDPIEARHNSPQRSFRP